MILAIFKKSKHTPTMQRKRIKKLTNAELLPLLKAFIKPYPDTYQLIESEGNIYIVKRKIFKILIEKNTQPSIATPAFNPYSKVQDAQNFYIINCICTKPSKSPPLIPEIVIEDTRTPVEYYLDDI